MEKEGSEGLVRRLQITTWVGAWVFVCVEGEDYISMPQAGPQMKHCWGG